MNNLTKKLNKLISPGKKRIYALINDKLNNICFDCEKEKSDYISINYGIFICKSCAEYHFLFLKDKSCILKKDLKSLSQKELKYLYYGGNRKLKDFMKNKYPLLLNLTRNQIYKTIGLDYYRKKLRYLVEGGEEPIEPIKPAASLEININNINDSKKSSFISNNDKFFNHNNMIKKINIDNDITNNHMIEYKHLTFNPNISISSRFNTEHKIYKRKNFENNHHNCFNTNLNYYQLTNDVNSLNDQSSFDVEIYNSNYKYHKRNKNISTLGRNLHKKIYIFNDKKSNSETKIYSKYKLDGVYSKPRLFYHSKNKKNMKRNFTTNELSSKNNCFNYSHFNNSFPFIFHYFNKIKGIDNKNSFLIHENINNNNKSNSFVNLFYNKSTNNYNDISDNSINSIQPIKQLKCLKIKIPEEIIKTREQDKKLNGNNDISLDNNSLKVKKFERNKTHKGQIKEIIIHKIRKSTEFGGYLTKNSINPIINLNNSSFEYNNKILSEKRNPVTINLNIFKSPKFFVSINKEAVKMKDLRNFKLKILNKPKINIKHIKDNLELKNKILNKNNELIEGIRDKLMKNEDKEYEEKINLSIKNENNQTNGKNQELNKNKKFDIKKKLNNERKKIQSEESYILEDYNKKEQKKNNDNKNQISLIKNNIKQKPQKEIKRFENNEVINKNNKYIEDKKSFYKASGFDYDINDLSNQKINKSKINESMNNFITKKDKNLRNIYDNNHSFYLNQYLKNKKNKNKMKNNKIAILNYIKQLNKKNENEAYSNSTTKFNNSVSTKYQNIFINKDSFLNNTTVDINDSTRITYKQKDKFISKYGSVITTGRLSTLSKNKANKDKYNSESIKHIKSEFISKKTKTIIKKFEYNSNKILSISSIKGKSKKEII